MLVLKRMASTSSSFAPCNNRPRDVAPAKLAGPGHATQSASLNDAGRYEVHAIILKCQIICGVIHGIHLIDSMFDSYMSEQELRGSAFLIR